MKMTVWCIRRGNEWYGGVGYGAFENVKTYSKLQNAKSALQGLCRVQAKAVGYRSEKEDVEFLNECFADVEIVSFDLAQNNKSNVTPEFVITVEEKKKKKDKTKFKIEASF
jgi:hypothetical protein